MSDNDELAAPRAVIVTVIKSEYQAVRTHLRDLREEEFSRTAYEHGKFFFSGERVWDVLLLETGFEAGRANAVTARETGKAIRYFKPLLVIYVGLAAGIRGTKVGDVVMATKVYGYE